MAWAPSGWGHAYVSHASGQGGRHHMCDLACFAGVQTFATCLHHACMCHVLSLDVSLPLLPRGDAYHPNN